LAALVWAAWLAAPAVAQAPAARTKWDTRVLAQIPAPGFGALSLVASDRRIYVGSFENPAGDNFASKVFRFGPDGSLETSFTPGAQDLSAPHGIQVAAHDAAGDLYLLEQSPPRMLRMNPNTGSWTYYASFAQVPTCSSGAAAGECKQAIADEPAEPDYAAWGPDGSLYVTDYQQALIWRVPPGGGPANVWFTDPRLDGIQFDAAGIVLAADHRSLLFDTAASAPSTGPDFTSGKLYQLPIGPDGKPGQLHQLWVSGPREAPDGFAVAQSGNTYLALVGPAVNQLVEISPQGQELGRYPPDPATNNALPVPYDEPSSVEFDGQRLIVTNLSYFAGNSAHQVLFDVWAGEPGMPIYHPPAAPASAATSAARAVLPQLIVSAHPRRLLLRARTRVHFLVTVLQGGRQLPVDHATVRIAGHAITTDPAGRATVVLRARGPASGRPWRAVATAPGYRPGQVDLHAVARRRRRAIAG
jgi:hypothetical protein